MLWLRKSLAFFSKAVIQPGGHVLALQSSRGAPRAGGGFACSQPVWSGHLQTTCDLSTTFFLPPVYTSEQASLPFSARFHGLPLPYTREDHARRAARGVVGFAILTAHDERTEKKATFDGDRSGPSLRGGASIGVAAQSTPCLFSRKPISRPNIPRSRLTLH